jgi:muconolactone delta-isomerase
MRIRPGVVSFTTCGPTTDEEGLVKIIAFDRFKPGVTMDTIQPLLAEEVANCWRLWKAGVVRENYARADEPGVVIVFEVDSVEEARAYVADFPMTKAGYLEWSYVALMAPVMLESQFDEAALGRAGLPPDRPAVLSEGG